MLTEAVFQEIGRHSDPVGFAAKDHYCVHWVWWQARGCVDFSEKKHKTEKKSEARCPEPKTYDPHQVADAASGLRGPSFSAGRILKMAQRSNPSDMTKQVERRLVACGDPCRALSKYSALRKPEDPAEWLRPSGWDQKG